MLSIIIPAYNEEKRIGPSVLLAARMADEVVVVADGTDNTCDAVMEAKAYVDNVVLVQSAIRLGKGGAFWKGVENACGSKVVLVDADFPVSSNLVPVFAELLDDFDVVVGSRYKCGGSVVGQTRTRRLLSYGYRRFYHGLFDLEVEDSQCGFKAFRRYVLEAVKGRMRGNGYTFDLELLLRIAHAGFSIHEFPVAYYHNGGSKVGLKDVYGMFKDTVRLHQYFQK